MPISNEETLEAFCAGVKTARRTDKPTVAHHLKNAGEHISGGAWADSVRESLHAVEACARILAPESKGLGPALAILSSRGTLHEAMKKGFTALYGYGSDKGGIRHAMLDGGDAAVTETDALFMLGACASFVTYLLSQIK